MLHRVRHYRIIEELGKGGMGVVFKAEDTRLNRIVALKLLSENSSADPKARKRFLREARLASSLQHQNICTIHEVGEKTNGDLFISMDYYEGETLQQKISSGINSLDLIVEYICQIALGLTQAHSKGIIHRDIKPSNIIVTPDGIVKILDFGLAKLSGIYDYTQTVKTVGTISYLSPEQAGGHEVDHRTDIWALGVVFYEMITGILPFTHEYEAAVIYSILDKSPLPPSEIREGLPEEIEHTIYKCLRKNREERTQSASELLQELEKIQEILCRKTGTNSTEGQSGKKGAERRYASILISEIAGYKELLKKLDEEKANRVMNLWFDTISQTSMKHGGILIIRNEQTFMIVFGISHSGEKVPARAILTAIELRDRLPQMLESEHLNVSLTLKCGIDSGMVIASPVMVNDRLEYNISGHTANNAVRLKDLSPEGFILVSPAIHKSTHRDFNFEVLKVPPSNGNSESDIAYLLTSGEARNTHMRTGDEWRIRSEMVGREEELDSLHYHLVKLIHGEGFIVNVIGEAGLGKSRLLAEFLHKPDIRKVVVLEGRALSSGLKLSFHPIIDIIRSLADINEKDDETEIYRKLEHIVQRYCPESAEEVFPFVGTLIGMSLTGSYAERMKRVEGEGLEKLILINLRLLLAGASLVKPLVFIIEDLHWSDQSSMGLLKSLYRLAENHPVLFINVLRPDYQNTGEQIRIAIRDRYEKYHAEILLKPLDDSQSGQLIRGLLNKKTLPEKISSLIKKRVEGNPFFLEEVIRSMIDDGNIFLEGNKVVCRENIDSVIIPDTINEVLMSRIDKLEDETRALVKLASVIGRQFFYRVLVEVANNREDVDLILDHLQGIQLIRKRKRMDEVEFLFKHALIQQAAYDTILSEQRKNLHLKVARAIETIFRERLQEFYGVLAYHYSHGEDSAMAESYLIKAGERALKSSASKEALEYYREALTIYLEKYGDAADPAKIATLNKYIGIAHYNIGLLIEATEYLGKALNYHGMKLPKNPILLIYQMIKGLAIFLFRIRFPSRLGRRAPTDRDIEINDLIAKKAAALTPIDSNHFVMEMIIYAPWYTRFRFKEPETLMLASAIFSFGGLSLNIGQRIVDCFDKKIDPHDIKAQVASASGRSVADLLSGNWMKRPFEEELVNKGLLLGDSFNIIIYLAFKAHEYMELGKREAEDILDKLSDLSEAYETDFGRLTTYTHSSLYLLKYRECEKALKLANEGIDHVKNKLGNKPGSMMIYSMKIRLQIMLGDLAGAKESMQIAGDFAAADRYAPYFISFFLTASLLFETSSYEHALKSDPDNILSGLKNQMYSTSKKGRKNAKKVAHEQVEILRLTGLTRWLTGNQNAALKWWKKSIERAEKLQAKLELALTLKEVASRLQEPSSRIDSFYGEDPGSLKNRADKLFDEMEITIE